jgi:glycosyltransferase involved in cell wall biosynthesis
MLRFFSQAAKMPKVSVITTVYNGEKYIREAIDSVLNQTLKDFELIVINDGSIDRTLEILRGYDDSRIITINNQKNIGIPKSLNKALQMAKGQYICRQDSDDISLPARLERQTKFLIENKDVGLVGTSYYRINGDGQEIGVAECPSGEKAIHFMGLPTIMVRKDCLEKMGGFREVFEIAEDYDLYLRISEVFRIGTIRESLYKYRVYNSSTTSSKRLQTDLYASLAIEMAEEREKMGKDRLSTANQKEAIKIRDQRLKVSGIKKRKVLSHNYSTWSQAAFILGEYKKSLNYAIDSLSQYILNYCAWDVLIKIIAKKFKDNPIKLITTASKFFANNLRQKIVMTAVSRTRLAPKMYWNHRAFNIDEKWGREKDDYALLRDIILSLKPQRLLDVGCGSGRLFPLYNDSEISEVVAQDISSEALKMAKDRYHFSNIKTTGQPILDLKFPMHYFDLIVSNRVLQHMPRGQIEAVIRKLTKLGKLIYINEMCDSDSADESFYLFHHNYVELFNKYGFKVIQKGLLGNKTWFLFSENI